jgi:hypothetical protein
MDIFNRKTIMNTMKIISQAVDYGDAPEIFVTGYSMVMRVSAGVIRETFYAVRQLSDGTMERRVTINLLWDAGEWLAAHRPEMVAEVSRLKPSPPPRETDELRLH